jgi:hypothetical protein
LETRILLAYRVKEHSLSLSGERVRAKRKQTQYAIRITRYEIQKMLVEVKEKWKYLL